MPELSVIICTHNRADYLPLSIGSLLQQSIPLKEFEIIVVDNNSSDATKEIVLQYSERGVRYIHESQVGLSAARNRGFEESRGNLIAYLDDDAIASRDWVHQYLAAFQQFGSNAGVIGGKIDLQFESPRPEWLSDRLLHFLGYLNLSEYARELKKGEWVTGANMAFRRKALEDIGGFSKALGRKGASLLSNEESLVLAELQQKKWKAFYSPEAVVRHIVHSERCSKNWFIKRLYWHGVSGAVEAMHSLRMGVGTRILNVLRRAWFMLKCAVVDLGNAFLGHKPGFDRFLFRYVAPTGAILQYLNLGSFFGRTVLDRLSSSGSEKG